MPLPTLCQSNETVTPLQGASLEVKRKMQLKTGSNREGVLGLVDLLKRIFTQWNGGSFKSSETSKTTKKQRSNYKLT